MFREGDYINLMTFQEVFKNGHRTAIKAFYLNRLNLFAVLPFQLLAAVFEGIADVFLFFLPTSEQEQVGNGIRHEKYVHQENVQAIVRELVEQWFQTIHGLGAEVAGNQYV